MEVRVPDMGLGMAHAIEIPHLDKLHLAEFGRGPLHRHDTVFVELPQLRALHNKIFSTLVEKHVVRAEAFWQSGLGAASNPPIPRQPDVTSFNGEILVAISE